MVRVEISIAKTTKINKKIIAIMMNTNFDLRIITNESRVKAINMRQNCAKNSCQSLKKAIYG